MSTSTWYAQSGYSVATALAEMPGVPEPILIAGGGPLWLVEDGKVTEIEVADSGGCRLLVLEVDRAGRLGSTPRSVQEAALCWRVGRGMEERKLFPPYDLLEMRWVNGLDPVPGATASWNATVYGTPFGELSITFQVVDGIPLTVAPGVSNNAEVSLSYQYHHHLQVRAGQREVVHLVGPGDRLEGDFDVLMMIAGLTASASWSQARAISATRLDDLVTMSSLVARLGDDLR